MIDNKLTDSLMEIHSAQWINFMGGYLKELSNAHSRIPYNFAFDGLPWHELSAWQEACAKTAAKLEVAKALLREDQSDGRLGNGIISDFKMRRTYRSIDRAKMKLENMFYRSFDVD